MQAGGSVAGHEAGAKREPAMHRECHGPRERSSNIPSTIGEFPVWTGGALVRAALGPKEPGIRIPSSPRPAGFVRPFRRSVVDPSTVFSRDAASVTELPSQHDESVASGGDLTDHRHKSQRGAGVNDSPEDEADQTETYSCRN